MKPRGHEWDMEPDFMMDAEPEASVQTVNTGESKRDKRRRDMVERVERLRRDNIDRREANFHDHIATLHESHLGLLSQPEPNNPLYLLRLHELSVRRDGLLLAAQVQGRRQQEVAQRLYAEEKERTETEFEDLRSSIKQRLLEACDERARKLKEEKDGNDLSLESFFDIPSFRNPPRMRRPPPGMSGPGGAASGADNSRIPLPPDAAAVLSNGVEPYTSSLLPSSPLLNALPSVGDASNMNASPLLAAALANLQAATLPATTTRGGYRKRGGGVPPGLPLMNSATLAIAPGKYEQARRCYAALTTLNGTEVTEDLDFVRRKRKRGGEQRGVAAKRVAVAERDP